MSAADIRRRIKNRIDAISPERLPLAEDFLAYLQERESNEATAELLQIPGFLEDMKQAESDVAHGRTTAWRKVPRKRTG